MQIFAVSVNKLVSVKIKTMGVVTSCKKVSRALELRSIESTKIKTVKIHVYLLKDYGVIPRIFAAAKISRYKTNDLHV